MSIALFCALAVLTAAWIAYPLWQGGRSPEPTSATASDHQRRHGPQRRIVQPAPGAEPAPAAPGGAACPACGQSGQPGDRFCVHCGAPLDGANEA